MAGTPEGHIESISTEEATPAGNLGGETKGDTMDPPHIGVEQLRARKREIDEAGQLLVWEYEKVDEEIRHCGDGGHTRVVARDVNQRIITDNETLPHFAWASQNIVAAMALLRGLPEAASPEDRRAHHEIHTLLERTVAQ